MSNRGVPRGAWRGKALSVVAAATLALSALPLFPGAAEASPKADGERASQVIAHLDGEPVEAAAFAPYLRAYLRSKLYHSGSPERVRAVAKEAVDAFLIDKVLVEQARERGLAVSDAEIDLRVKQLKDAFKSRPDWPQIEKRLPILRQEIEKDLQISSLKQAVLAGSAPTAAEVRAFYQANPDKFTRPAAFRLSLLLISVDPGAGANIWRGAEARAKALAHSVEKGADFAAVAREHSGHHSAPNGGALGEIHEGQFGEGVDAALGSAKPGALVGPLRVLEGFALFKLHDRRPPQLTPFAKARDRARDLLNRRRAEERWRAHLDTVRTRFTIDQFAFDAFLAEAAP